MPCGGTARRVKGGEHETCETRKGSSFSRRRKPKGKGFRGFRAPLTPVPGRAKEKPRARERARAGGSSEDGARGGEERSTSRHEKGPLQSREPGSKGRVPWPGKGGSGNHGAGSAAVPRTRPRKGGLAPSDGARGVRKGKQALGGLPPRACGLVRHFEEVADVGFAERRVVVVDEIAHGVVALGVKA